MENVFGQDITAYFYPLVDDAAFTPSDTAQTPSIYVFDAMPSRTVAAAGTGAVAGPIATWTWNAGTKGFSFTIPAIDDPTPTSTDSQKIYYLGISFKLAAAEQTQTVVQGLTLYRVVGHQTSVGVTLDDMAQYFPQVGAYSSESQRLGYIAEAISEVQDKLRSAGYAWSRINRPDRLKRVVTLRSLALLLLFQVQAGNDKFMVKYLELKQMAKDAFDALKIEYDADGDGVVDAVTEPSSNMALLIR